jgi:heme A synthase
MDTVKGEGEGNKRTGLRIYGIVTVGLLVVQFILGMITNLFVQFPDTTQEVQQWEFARMQLPLMMHIALGLLLFVSGITFLVRAINARERIWIISSSTGLLGIVAAIISGTAFVPTQADRYSLLMALAFMLALLAYGWGLYASRE